MKVKLFFRSNLEFVKGSLAYVKSALDVEMLVLTCILLVMHDKIPIIASCCYIVLTRYWLYKFTPNYINSEKYRVFAIGLSSLGSLFLVILWISVILR